MLFGSGGGIGNEEERENSDSSISCVDYSTTDSYNQKTSGSVVIDIGLALEDVRGYYAALPGSKQVNLLPVTVVEPLFEALDLLGSAG